MQPKSDAQSLREYAEHGSEPAFGELVARYTDLVYSAALRQVESPDLARDVAQSVFTDLARKARSLTGKLADDASLVGWLYRSTRFASLTLLRDDRRRQSRERQAMQNLDSAPEASPDWDRVRPVLDEAMANLSDDDRDALLLRFFKNQEFRSVGAALGVTDDAAQKRVTRALDKLRVEITRRGVTTTAAALTAALSASAVQVAPTGLAAALAGASLAGAAAATGTTSALTSFVVLSKIQAGIVAATVAARVATPLLMQHQAQKQLHAENGALRQHLEQLTPLIAETERLSNLVAHASAAEPRSSNPSDEILRLRAEITRLRGDSQELARLRAAGTQRAEIQSGSTLRVEYGLKIGPSIVSKRGLVLRLLARMKEHLNLTAEQEQPIREALLKKMESDLQRAGPLEFDIAENQIKALLTTEQLAAYPEFQREEGAAVVRQAAQREVWRLADGLSLTMQQKDTLTAILGELYAKRMPGTSQPPDVQALAGLSPTERVRRQAEIAQEWLDETLWAFEKVLTPEQFKMFREDEQSKVDYMKLNQPSLPAAERR